MDQFVAATCHRKLWQWFVTIMCCTDMSRALNTLQCYLMSLYCSQNNYYNMKPTYVIKVNWYPTKRQKQIQTECFREFLILFFIINIIIFKKISHKNKHARHKNIKLLRRTTLYLSIISSKMWFANFESTFFSCEIFFLCSLACLFFALSASAEAPGLPDGFVWKYNLFKYSGNQDKTVTHDHCLCSKYGLCIAPLVQNHAKGHL